VHTARCTRNGYLPTIAAPFMTISGGKHSKAWLEAAKDAMGMPWVKTIREVCEAVPPAYSEFIGEQLMAHLALAVAA
jgi:DNA (cytosine-5)-methyltransferase 1